jgi:hypothetical protein
MAAEYASSVRARLHLLHALPEMEDGVILPLAGSLPLEETGARKEILALIGRPTIKPEVHITTRDGRRARASLLRDCDADLLFTSVGSFPLTDWARSDLDLIDRYSCPSICVGAAAKIAAWQLLPGPAYAIPVTRAQRIA